MIDQVEALRSTIPKKPERKPPLFREGPPPATGGGGGGGTTRVAAAKGMGEAEPDRSRTAERGSKRTLSRAEHRCTWYPKKHLQKSLDETCTYGCTIIPSTN